MASVINAIWRATVESQARCAEPVAIRVTPETWDAITVEAAAVGRSSMAWTGPAETELRELLGLPVLVTDAPLGERGWALDVVT